MEWNGKQVSGRLGTLRLRLFPFVVLQQRLYFAELDCWIPYTTLPRYTESRIEQLCTEAKTARTEGDAKGAVENWRKALSVHPGYKDALYALSFVGATP